MYFKTHLSSFFQTWLELWTLFHETWHPKCSTPSQRLPDRARTPTPHRLSGPPVSMATAAAAVQEEEAAAALIMYDTSLTFYPTKLKLGLIELIFPHLSTFFRCSQHPSSQWRHPWWRPATLTPHQASNRPWPHHSIPAAHHSPHTDTISIHLPLRHHRHREWGHHSPSEC